MKKIQKYKLVSHHSLEWFNKFVQDLINAGYEPFGEHKVTIQTCEDDKIITYYSQVMVKYEEDSEAKE